MKERINNLIKIANALDKHSLESFASSIDGISQKYLAIKTAQYVGVQGYWIRNERCWSNCYRQKRVNSPKLSSQEVWCECQNEYADSINNDKSDWAKYANEDTVMKFASVKMKKAASKILDHEQKHFDTTVAQKVEEEGMDLPVAIFNTINERQEKYVEAHIDLAGDLLNIAEDLKEQGFEKVATAIAVEANEIVKESQGMWRGLTNMFRGEQGKIIAYLDDIRKYVNKTYKELSAEQSNARQNPAAMDSFRQYARQSIRQFTEDLPEKVRLISNIVAKSKSVPVRLLGAKVIQTINKWQNDFLAAPKKNIGSFQQLSTLLNNAISNVQNIEPEQQQQAAPAEADIEQTAPSPFGETPEISKPIGTEQAERAEEIQNQYPQGTQFPSEGSGAPKSTQEIKKWYVNELRPILQGLTTQQKAALFNTLKKDLGSNV